MAGTEAITNSPRYLRLLSQARVATLIVVLVLGAMVIWGTLQTPATSLGSNPDGYGPSWLFDVTDDRLLVGGADNAFVARVVSIEAGSPMQTRSVGIEFPTTTYVVEPIDTIKGSLGPTVSVNQLGGYDSDGMLRLFAGDELLASMSTYLLVTSVDGPLNVLVAPGHDKYVADDPAIRLALVTRFTEAYSNEEDPFAPSPTTQPSPTAQPAPSTTPGYAH